jgi:hypothetical protein
VLNVEVITTTSQHPYERPPLFAGTGISYVSQCDSKWPNLLYLTFNYLKASKMMLKTDSQALTGEVVVRSHPFNLCPVLFAA